MLGGLAALFALVVGSAQALDAPRSPTRGGDSLIVAKRESGVKGTPDAALETPAGTLRILNPELVAAKFGQAIRFELTVARDVPVGSVEVGIPARWRTRTVSDLVPSRVPRNTRSAAGVRLQTGGGAATLQLAGTNAGAQAAFEIVDTGIPAGTYRLPVRWTDAQGTRSLGDLEVRLYAPAREGITPAVGSGSDERVPFNVTNDASTESETFVTVVPNDTNRVLVGANGGSGYNAWFSVNGGANFTKLAVPASMDVPGGPQLGALCCDPYSMADDQGNLWYGGLTIPNANGPSRIHISRIAAGTATFVNTVGLPERTGGGTQDKPMGAIDMNPASPHYGRLYVVWGEPAGGAVNIVVSMCDTRPNGTLNAAHCDNADSWSTPVSVTQGIAGSYIYAEVAAAPDGKVYVIWWDYSATNAIRGATCAANQDCATAAGWSTAGTIATLDASGGAPIPFACPIVAQPGGRVGPATSMDVDRATGTVYVTWSDLRADSGSTRCTDGLTPAATHRTWDSFVAAANGVLPGGASPSAIVGARIIADGEGGGQANSDEWFPAVTVDQSTGRAYVNVYSTRDDVTRKTMHVYARQVNADEQLGPLVKVSTAASDYSANPCCGFGNDYGDYTGIDAAGGFAFVVWSDKSNTSGTDGEAFFDKVQLAAPSEPAITFGAWTFAESVPSDGDGVFEAGEDVTLSAPLDNNGPATATSAQGILTTTSPHALVLEGAKAYGNIPAGGKNVIPASPYRIRLLSTLPCGQQLVPLHLQVSYTVGTGSRDDMLTTNTTCPPPPASPPPAPPALPNAGPNAVITGPNTATAGRVNFDAGGSADSDGTIARFQWDADGNAGNGYEVDTGATPRLAATLAAGSRTVSVRVTDNGGASAQASKAVRVVPAAAVRLVGNGASIRVRSGRFRLVVAGCAGCRGRLTVMAATRGRAAGSQLLGTARFTIGRNGRATVPVRLSSNGRRLLQRLNPIRSIVSLTVTNAAGQTRTAGGRIALRR